MSTRKTFENGDVARAHFYEERTDGTKLYEVMIWNSLGQIKDYKYYVAKDARDALDIYTEDRERYLKYVRWTEGRED